jgi:hypothetical protein
LLSFSRTDDVFEGGARWNLTDTAMRAQQIELKPRLS